MFRSVKTVSLGTLDTNVTGNKRKDLVSKVVTKTQNPSVTVDLYV